jgi:hypothetical protein
MRVLHNHPMGAGSIYELHNLKALCIRLPAYVIIAFLYGKFSLSVQIWQGYRVRQADDLQVFTMTFIALRSEFWALLKAAAWTGFTLT